MIEGGGLLRLRESMANQRSGARTLTNSVWLKRGVRSMMKPGKSGWNQVMTGVVSHQ